MIVIIYASLFYLLSWFLSYFWCTFEAKIYQAGNGDGNGDSDDMARLSENHEGFGVYFFALGAHLVVGGRLHFIHSISGFTGSAA